MTLKCALLFYGHTVYDVWVYYPAFVNEIICFTLQLQTADIKQVIFPVKLHGNPINM